MLFCSKCNNLFIETLLSENSLTGSYLCPIGCDNDLEFLDEDIAVLIRFLNNKGFKTLYSCSGHIVNSLIKGAETAKNIGQAYIKFEYNSKNLSLFSYIKDNYSYMLDEEKIGNDLILRSKIINTKYTEIDIGLEIVRLKYLREFTLDLVKSVECLSNK